MPGWIWIVCAGVGLAAVLEELRIYKMRRDSRRQQEIFQAVTENAADMIALVDVKGHRLYNSPSYKRILGYSPAELSETSAFEQIHPEDRLRVLEAARAARESGVGQRLEYRIKHKDGSWRVLESLASTIRNANGEVAKLVIVNRDITERKRAEAQLEYNLFHDPLTGLPNRRMFLDRLNMAFARGKSAGSSYALLLANIDHFKVFNDTMGSAAGDQVLAEIARRMNNALRQDTGSSTEPSAAAGTNAALFRLGGDEFAILLESVLDPSDALRRGKAIQLAVAEPLHIDSREVRVSISTGIALSTDTHARPEDALKDVDVAMRRAKGLGGSRCEVFDEGMHTRAVGRLRLESDLRTAFAQRQFRIHYQPVVHLKTRRLVSLEALLRWDHPTEGLISPYRFIEAADDTGLLVSIGHWLIVQACMQLRKWELNDRIAEPISITINLSARQLADARLASDIQDALQETGIDPSRLQLEMTEHVAAVDPKLTVTVLSHLKHFGITTILDDFGTGPMSLMELTRFPIDALKIDRALTREMQSDRATADIVELIIAMARKMKFNVIAEGIETARQLQKLQELGCELGQGYYFSQPLDESAALSFIQKQVAGVRSNSAGAV